MEVKKSKAPDTFLTSGAFAVLLTPATDPRRIP